MNDTTESFTFTLGPSAEVPAGYYNTRSKTKPQKPQAQPQPRRHKPTTRKRARVRSSTPPGSRRAASSAVSSAEGTGVSSGSSQHASSLRLPSRGRGARGGAPRPAPGESTGSHAGLGSHAGAGNSAAGRGAAAGRAGEGSRGTAGRGAASRGTTTVATNAGAGAGAGRGPLPERAQPRGSRVSQGPPRRAGVPGSSAAAQTAPDCDLTLPEAQHAGDGLGAAADPTALLKGLMVDTDSDSDDGDIRSAYVNDAQTDSQLAPGDTCEVGIAEVLARVVQQNARRELEPQVKVMSTAPRRKAEIKRPEEVGDDKFVRMIGKLSRRHAKHSATTRALRRNVTRWRSVMKDKQAVMMQLLPRTATSRNFTMPSRGKCTVEVKRIKSTAPVTLERLRPLLRRVVGDYLQRHHPEMWGKPFNPSAVAALTRTEFLTLANKAGHALRELHASGELDVEKEELVVIAHDADKGTASGGSGAQAMPHMGGVGEVSFGGGGGGGGGAGAGAGANAMGLS